MEIGDLLTLSVKSGASDLHLSANNPPIMRVSGDMIQVKHPPFTHDQVKKLIYSIMTDAQRADYERDLEIDFAITYGANLRFRVNAFNGINGAAAVFRSIATEIHSLEQLGTPDLFKKLCQIHKGIILVTGPTGSGKSTTLAAMLDYINSNFSKHIITIEDPVEFVHKSKRSLINQREVGSNTKSFARALKSALREDPDIVLVGELRDIETIQLALTAAETGHLVLATLHTSAAPKTINRIIDVFPDTSKDMVRAMLSVSLEAVIAQCLLKRADGTGRVAAWEIMLGNPAVRNLIRENRIPQLYSIMQTSVKIGMQTMKDSVYNLRDKGIISHDEARQAILSSSDEESGSNSRPTIPGKETQTPPVTPIAMPPAIEPKAVISTSSQITNPGNKIVSNF